MIRQVFIEEDAKAILSYPICPIEKDQQVWCHTSSGTYSVKSAGGVRGRCEQHYCLAGDQGVGLLDSSGPPYRHPGPFEEQSGLLLFSCSFGVAYASLGKSEPWPCPVGGGVFVTPTRPTTQGFGHVVARSRWLCATCLDIVTPNTGRPCAATVLGGVSRPSNVRVSDLIKSQWVLLLRHPAHPCPALLPFDFLSSPI
ncbi:hypothetical protein V6N13_057315 [Hibiscus sabdariffa]